MEKLNITRSTTRDYVENRIAEYYKYYENNRENTDKREIKTISRPLIKQLKDDRKVLSLASSKKIISNNSALQDYSEFIFGFKFHSKDLFNVFSEISSAKTWYDNTKKE